MVRWALFAILVGGCIEPRSDDGTGVVRAAVTNRDARTTHYVVAQESQLTGNRTGDRTMRTLQGAACSGGPNCYHNEFLCSAWGVAMQGTGRASDGKLIHYVSGGSGWLRQYGSCSGSNACWLGNCQNARFEVVDQVRGASGQVLEPGFSCAADSSVPFGSCIWIESEMRWCRVDDRGGMVRGSHIDLYAGETGMSVRADISPRTHIVPPDPNNPCRQNNPSPWTGATGDTVCPPATPIDCTQSGGSGCCPSTHAVCCPDGQHCSLDGSDCPGATPTPTPSTGGTQCPDGYPVECWDSGRCCPNTHPLCCTDGTCAMDGDPTCSIRI